jgi:hypothetical protein
MVVISSEQLDKIPVGDCIQCLGSHTSHTLELKFEALQKAGFTITEFSFAEYYRWVRSRHLTLCVPIYLMLRHRPLILHHRAC